MSVSPDLSKLVQLKKLIESAMKRLKKIGMFD